MQHCTSSTDHPTNERNRLEHRPWPPSAVEVQGVPHQSQTGCEAPAAWLHHHVPSNQRRFRQTWCWSQESHRYKCGRIEKWVIVSLLLCCCCCVVVVLLLFCCCVVVVLLLLLLLLLCCCCCCFVVAVVVVVCINLYTTVLIILFCCYGVVYETVFQSFLRVVDMVESEHLMWMFSFSSILNFFDFFLFNQNNISHEIILFIFYYSECFRD